MASITGRSAVRTVTVGIAPRRATGGDGNERVMELVRDGSDVYIHLHSPDSFENGWAITVSLEDFLAAARTIK